MPIKVFRDIPTLGTQSFFGLNSEAKRLAGQVKTGVGLSHDNTSATYFKVSGESSIKSRVLGVAIENVKAADSIIFGADITKKIAILTRSYILESAKLKP